MVLIDLQGSRQVAGGVLTMYAAKRRNSDRNYLCPNPGRRPHRGIGGGADARCGQKRATKFEIPDDDRVPVAEIRDSVDLLTKPDLARLDLAAQGFSSLCGLDPEDLLQEALTRALEGRRTCKRGTPFVPFICGVMKSLASEEIEARKDGRRPVTVLRNGKQTLPDAQSVDAVAGTERDLCH